MILCRQEAGEEKQEVVVVNDVLDELQGRMLGERC